MKSLRMKPNKLCERRWRGGGAAPASSNSGRNTIPGEYVMYREVGVSSAITIHSLTAS